MATGECLNQCQRTFTNRPHWANIYEVQYWIHDSCLLDISNGNYKLYLMFRLKTTSFCSIMSSWYHDKGVGVNLHTPKVINVVKTICIRWNIYYDIQCANPKPAAWSPHPNKAISMNNSLRDPQLIVHHWVANVPNASWQPQGNCQQPFKRTEKAYGFVVVCCVWLYETDLWNKSANAGELSCRRRYRRRVVRGLKVEKSKYLFIRISTD